MEFIVLNGPDTQGPIRFNLHSLICYDDETLYLQGGVVLEISPGTSIALDKTLKERSGCSILRVETIKED